MSVTAIVILAIAQLFIIQYAYKLKFGELEFVYKNVYEYAKPFFEIQWDEADQFTQARLDDKTLTKGGKIEESYMNQLTTTFINSDFINSKIEEYFSERDLLEEVEFALIMKNVSLSIDEQLYTPLPNQEELPVLGKLQTSKEGNLVYRHIANSNYITADFDLFIYFPDRTLLLIGEMKWILILSTVTFLLISYVSISNLINWQKQKQLSAVKDDLIDHLSHEFRTPITSINIASESIQNNGKELGLSRVMEISRLIKRQGSRLQRMVDNLLNTAFLDQNQPANKHLTTVDDFLDHYVTDLQFLEKDTGVTILHELNAKEASAMIDTFLFESLLNNLIDNSIKYNQNAPVIQIRSSINHNQYELSITDNGEGISEKHLSEVFNKFQRFNKTSKGLGLGLYHVRQIMELHDGSIHIESKTDKGTIFTITLPLS